MRCAVKLVDVEHYSTNLRERVYEPLIEARCRALLSLAISCSR